MKSTLIKFTLVALAAIFAIAIRAAEPVSNELQRTLTEARAQLDQMKHKYTDSHPSVIEQKAKVAALEAQVATRAMSKPQPKPRFRRARSISIFPAAHSATFWPPCQRLKVSH